MLRKWLALLLAAVMLMSLVPASAEASQQGVYRLVKRTESGLVTVGMAALVDQSGTMLLTSADAVTGEDPLFAVGADGTIAVTAVKTGEHGLARLMLNKPSTLEPFAFTTAAPAVYLARLSDGSEKSGTVDQIMEDEFKDLPALSVHLCGGVLPGTMLFADGKLAGMVIAAQNEGIDRYLCFSAQTLYAELLAMTYSFDDNAAPDPGDAVKPMIEMDEAGFMCVDISPLDPELEQKWAVYYADVNNIYFSTAYQQMDKVVQCSVIPGHTYMVWVRPADADKSDVVPEKADALFTVPETEPFSDYGFTQGECFVGLSDSGELNNEGLMDSSTDKVAISDLRNGKHLYVSVSSSYAISGDDVELPSLMVIQAEHGGNLSSASSYTFSTAYMPTDAWKLDITELLLQGFDYLGFPFDAYTLTYYIAGHEAGSCSFEVVADEAQPQGTSEGVIPDVTVTEQGQIHVDISGLTQDPAGWYVMLIPEGLDYYSVINFDTLTQDISLLPGRGYALLLGKGDAEHPDDDQILGSLRVMVPESGDFTDYGFRDAGSFVTIDADPSQPHPQSVLTLEALEQGAFIASVSSSYEVTGQITLPALAILTDPQGHFIWEYSEYIFSPEYMPVDRWTMDLNGMLSKLNALNGRQMTEAGDYSFTYYIGGRKAVDIAFTLVHMNMLDGNAAPEAPVVLTTSLHDGLLEVDFSDFGMTEPLTISLQDTGNVFMTTFIPNEGETVARMPVVPGRTYRLWLNGADERPITGTAAEVTVPEAEPFTQHAYHEEGAWVTLAQPEMVATDSSLMPVVDELTIERMNAGEHLMLSSTSYYQVEKNETYLCKISLITPDGSCLLDEQSLAFTLETGLQNGDFWVLDLSNYFGGMISYTAQGGWVPGPYTVTWYFGGQPAGSVSFLLN